jgi:hypothetical protein
MTGKNGGGDDCRRLGVANSLDGFRGAFNFIFNRFQ